MVIGDQLRLATSVKETRAKYIEQGQETVLGIVIVI
jgi:hypothetical protein